MTLLQLRYFQLLSRTLHYTHTAEQLHISQPSLSYAINELEKELGVKLFQKEKQKVRLTSYGLQFLPYVDQCLSVLQEGRDAIQSMADNAPRVVRLGYPQSVSHSFVPRLIQSVYRHDPEHRILFQFTEASSLDVLGQIQAGDLDAGVVFHLADWAESVPIGHQHFFLAVPAEHPLAQRQSVDFLDFAREPQVMLKQGNSLRLTLDHVYAKFGMIPNVVFEVKELNAALQYVALGFGLSVIPPRPDKQAGQGPVGAHRPPSGGFPPHSLFRLFQDQAALPPGPADVHLHPGKRRPHPGRGPGRAGVISAVLANFYIFLFILLHFGVWSFIFALCRSTFFVLFI